MKNKIKLLMLSIVILSGIQSFPQTLNYKDIGGEKPKGYHDQYISKDGVLYKRGDTISLVKGSGPNGEFIYVNGVVARPGVGDINSKIIIDGFYVNGSKKSGWKVGIMTKHPMNSLMFYIEDAVLAGEIRGPGMTSDEALAELKKCKEKLDLNLITEEEFNKKKAELSKWIK
jgi:hypothetical protein